MVCGCTKAADTLNPYLERLESMLITTGYSSIW